MFNNVIIIHGIGGLHREPYFNSLKLKCESLGMTVYMPSLGGYRDNTTYDMWKNYFDKNLLSKINDKTLVIAQSMGTQFVVKYFAEKKINVGLYISLAAPGDILDIRPEMSEKAKSFKPVSTQFKPTHQERLEFKNLPFKKYSFYSNNDTFFTMENLEDYIQSIGSEAIFVKDRAHFNSDTLKSGLVELESFIENIVKEQP